MDNNTFVLLILGGVALFFILRMWMGYRLAESIFENLPHQENAKKLQKNM